MGKLKEKLLNNLSNQEMDEQYELSAFEYVELLSKYKEQNEEEYVPTDEELANIDAMVGEYYKSKEFRDYVENYTPTDEFTDVQINEFIIEHNFNEDEIEAINESSKLKYTDNDILDVLDGMVDPQKMDIILGKFNEVWNNKNGVF